MSAKRALKLDSVKKDTQYDETPLETKLKNLNTYSPTTGTCEMSPFSSPVSHDAQNLKNHLSDDPKEIHCIGEKNCVQNQELLHCIENERQRNRMEQNGSASRLPRRGQPQTEKDVFMELQCKVKSSLDRILKIRESLTSLQALEGSRELENVGVSASSCNLRDEVQKTQELMSQAEELQLLERDHGKLLAQKDIDYLCVVRDLENSIKGVVQRFHKFPSYSVYTDIGWIQTSGSSAFLKSLLDGADQPVPYL